MSETTKSFADETGTDRSFDELVETRGETMRVGSREEKKFGTLVGNSRMFFIHQRGPNNVQGYHGRV